MHSEETHLEKPGPLPGTRNATAWIQSISRYRGAKQGSAGIILVEELVLIFCSAEADCLPYRDLSGSWG